MTNDSPRSNAVYRLHRAQHCYGTWLASGSTVATEIASLIGFDWLLLDMEHGYLTEGDVLAHLQVMRANTEAAIVRVPTHDAGLIGRLLDRGAGGIMVPHVSSREQAEALVRAMRFPPLGSRGCARSVRSLDYGLRSLDDGAADEPVLMVQIEEWQGVRSASEIAAVDGVHVLFVGPADLQLDLSHRKDAVAYEDALTMVSNAAQLHGKYAGILLRDAQEVAVLKEKGFSRIAFDSDIGVLRTGFQQALASLRGAA